VDIGQAFKHLFLVVSLFRCKFLASNHILDQVAAAPGVTLRAVVKFAAGFRPAPLLEPRAALNVLLVGLAIRFNGRIKIDKFQFIISGVL
jgi:hypothetical protein